MQEKPQLQGQLISRGKIFLDVRLSITRTHVSFTKTGAEILGMSAEGSVDRGNL